MSEKSCGMVVSPLVEPVKTLRTDHTFSEYTAIWLDDCASDMLVVRKTEQEVRAYEALNVNRIINTKDSK